MRIPLLLIACTTSVACHDVRASYVPTVPAARAARAPQNVDIFDVAVPKQPYVEVGRLQVERSAWTADDDVLRRIRQEAGEHGCDGVIMTSLDARREYPWRMPGKAMTGTCIVYNP